MKRDGRAVHVPDHAYRDSRTRPTFEETEKMRGGMRGALSQMTSTVQPNHGYPQIKHRSGLGVPLSEKAPRLETEIGVVEMTAELVGGFDNDPSPASKEDAIRLVREAARRYAELSAFIAAEQGLSPEEMAKLKLIGGDVKPPLPVEVIEALERTSSGSDLSLEEKIVYTLDGTLEDDPNIIASAAEMYGEYVEVNTQAIFGENTYSKKQYNLRYALDLLSDTYYGKSEPVYDLKGDGSSGRGGGHLCVGWLKDSGVEDVIRSSGTAPTDIPIVEEFSNGVRVNISDERSIELTYGSSIIAGNEMWFGSIRRIVETGEDELVVASGSSGYEYGTTEAVMNAIDFDRPLPRFWERRNVVGLKDGLR